MSALFSQGHALIVGVGADLPNTVTDAEGLADILKDESRCAYPPEQVLLLTGENATRDDILDRLDWLADTTDEDSTVVIFFSGHGYRVTATTGQVYYLMPFGYNVDQLYKTAISGAEFVKKLRAIHAGRLLLLLDCCYAGGLDDIKAPGLQIEKSALPGEAQSLFAQGKGRVVIASSQDEEVSFTGKPYSVFTRTLLEAFCGQEVSKKDGYVRTSDLVSYTTKMVPRYTKDRQNPKWNFAEADNFFLAYYAAGDSEPKALPFTPEGDIDESVAPTSAGTHVGDTLSGTFHGPVDNQSTNINIDGSVNGQNVNIGGNQTFHGNTTFGHHPDKSRD